MQLSQAIKELIYSNDCVTIPDFGSFIANRFPSIYNKEESKFYPPSRRLSFNSKIKNNDGLLANFISTENNISYDDALKQIHSEVVNWKRTISKEPLFIKDIGEISYNVDENLVFKPDLDSNHFVESFGLFPIYVNRIEKEVQTYNSSTLKKYNEIKSNKQTSGVPQLMRLAAVFVAIIAGTFFMENKYDEISFNNEMYVNENSSDIYELYNFKKTMQENEMITPILDDKEDSSKIIKFTSLNPDDLININHLLPPKSTWITPRI